MFRFDKMYQSTRKDLEALKNAYQHGDPVPHFHYETRQFSLVQYVPYTSCAALITKRVRTVVLLELYSFRTVNQLSGHENTGVQSDDS